MNKETAVINEVRDIPIIGPYSAISRFIQVMHYETGLVLPNLISINCETGEAIVAELEPETEGPRRVKVDAQGHAIQRIVYLDKKKYYIAFK